MSARELLWSHTGDDKDTARLRLGPGLEADPRPGRIAHLAIRAESVDLDQAAAHGLRDALNALLDDAGSAESTSAAQALHAAQHRQLEVMARRIAEQLNEHTTELAGVAGRARDAESAREEVSLEYVAEVVHLLAVQQQRVAASLGDLLAALGGQS